MDYQRLIWSPPTHGVILIDDVLVQLWEREAPADAFRRIASYCEERKRLSPDRPLWMLAVAGEGSRTPDAEARGISATFPAYFTEFVLVIEGSGFGASAARAAMASMSMMSSKRTRPAIVASVPDACATLARVSGGATDAVALTQCIGAARTVLRRI